MLVDELRVFAFPSTAAMAAAAADDAARVISESLRVRGQANVMFATGNSPAAIVAEKGAVQISDRDSIVSAVQHVFAANQEVVAKFKAGNLNVKGFLVGQVMREMAGRANPGLVQEIVQEELEG